MRLKRFRTTRRRASHIVQFFFFQSSAEPFQSPLYIRAGASSKHRTVWRLTSGKYTSRLIHEVHRSEVGTWPDWNLLTGQEVISNAKLQVEEDSASCAQRYLESKSLQLLAMICCRSKSHEVFGRREVQVWKDGQGIHMHRLSCETNFCFHTFNVWGKASKQCLGLLVGTIRGLGNVSKCQDVHGAVLPGMGPAAADSQRGEHAEVSFWRTFSTFMTGAATTVSKCTHEEKPRSLKGCAAVLLATPIWLCRRWRPFRKPCVSLRKGNSSFCRHGLAHRLQLWLLGAPKIQWAIIFDSRQNGKTNHVWNMQIQQKGAVRTFIGAWQVKTNIDKLTAANMPGEDAQPPRKLLGPLQQSFFSPGEIAGPRWGNRAYGVCSWFVPYVPASRY